MTDVKFRLIGDIHGDIPTYVDLARGAEYSLQVGDLGFDYTGVETLDSDRHKVIGGNHDNYTVRDGIFVRQPPHFLGDYGSWDVPGLGKLFYIRGGRSIDRVQRTEGLDWWPDEELTYKRLDEVISAYAEAKPDFVVSHEVPAFLIQEVTLWPSPIAPSMTSRALENMFDRHQPKAWVFGHFHHDWVSRVKGTYFRCLNIQSIWDVEVPFTEVR